MQSSLVTPLKNFFERRRTNQELTRELHNLKMERDSALNENIKLHALLDYQKETSELIDFKKRYVLDKALISQVVTKHFSEQAHYFLIDAGSGKGVNPDMVAVYNNCLIGRVSEVYPLYSKVVLITDKSCKVAACCMKTKAYGIYQGTNNLSSGALTQVSHLSHIINEDMLLSTGEGLIFPKGFALGKINSYQVQGLFYTIITKPIVDMREIKYCQIIRHDGSTI